MITIKNGIFIVILIFLQTIAFKVYAYDLKEIARTVSPSVLLLEIFDKNGEKIKNGTGFCISNDGLIVTNHHVIDGAVKIVAVTKSKKRIQILGKIAENKERDLAIIKAAQTSIAPLVLYKDKTIEPGERVIVVGGPLGLAGTLSEGIVSAIRNTDEFRSKEKRKINFDLLQITAPTSPGSSGSPVMNHNGEVIGVVVSQFRFGQNLNFAIPVNEVSLLLTSVDINKVAEPFVKKSMHKIELIFGLSILLLILIVSFVFYFKNRKNNSKINGQIIQGPWVN